MQKHIIITLVIVALASVACEARRKRPGKRPSSPCRRIACNIKCSNGLVKDSKGCPECKCNPPPTTTPAPCPPVCMIHCPNGNVKDDNGCNTCKCNEEPAQCRRIACNIKCSNGLVKDSKDSKGCPTCECNPPPTTPGPCPVFMCEDPCPDGYAKDSEGCQTCKCKKPVSCPEMMCMIYCPNGNVKDDKGCDICKCKCPEIMCRIHCPNGYVKDSNGCQTCSCNKPAPCPRIGCINTTCSDGYVKNSKGCETCECNPPSGQCTAPAKVGDCKARLRRFFYNTKAKKCQRFFYGGCKGNKNNYKSMRECRNTCPKQTSCPQRRCMMRKCPNGFAKNSNGCQTCRCNRRTDLCTGRKDVGNKRCSDLSNAGMKYYFDKKTGKCQQFEFKGCRGNSNRYRTEHDCMCRCTKTEESCKKAGTKLIKS